MIKNTYIDFVHIFFKNDSSRGAISNEIDDFFIAANEANVQDSLVISVLAYLALFVHF